jgi:hypothetical protein
MHLNSTQGHTWHPTISSSSLGTYAKFSANEGLKDFLGAWMIWASRDFNSDACGSKKTLKYLRS